MNDEEEGDPLTDAQRNPFPLAPSLPNAFHYGGWRAAPHAGVPLPAGLPAEVSDTFQK